MIHLTEAKEKGVLSWLLTQGFSTDDDEMPPSLCWVPQPCAGESRSNRLCYRQVCGAGVLPAFKVPLSRFHSPIYAKIDAPTIQFPQKNRKVRVWGHYAKMPHACRSWRLLCVHQHWSRISPVQDKLGRTPGCTCGRQRASPWNRFFSRCYHHRQSSRR